MSESLALQVSIMGGPRPQPSEPLGEAAQAFARWLEGDDDAMPASAVLRAEFLALERARQLMGKGVLDLQRDLQAGYERDQRDHDMPSCHSEFAAGFRAGAANVAAHAAGRIAAALHAAEQAVR